ncbi:hypothetical protein Tsp_03544 [Trichinella spiralis]|uniref:hypothetical protein n=1 Tax=Trichinella spiralis TaxID=6334 RepID=UPI0001EFB62A|nr:hypothetical protein Tsp_03544 [Trichinella spiralis]
MVSCNIRIKDDFKGNLTSNIIYIQHGRSRCATLQKIIVLVVSPLHYLTFSKHKCISRSAEYVYANVKVNIADGILLRALCAIQIRKTALLFNYSLVKSVLITHCIALFGYFGASLQQKRCDC